MKHRLAILAFAAVFAIASAAEFSAQIIPTKAVNISDQFAGILPDRPPFFPVVSKVVCGEPFRVEVTFHDAAVQDGTMKIEGKIIMTDPKGKSKTVTLDSLTLPVQGNAAGVFVLPKTLAVSYEPQDLNGKHTFALELTDRHSGRTAKASAAVEYVEKIEPESGKNPLAQITGYYRAPQAEYIVPAFRKFLATLPKQKAKEKKNFNPLPQLAFFTFLLQENPQVVPEFATVYRTLKGEEQYLASVVLNFVSVDAAKVLSKEQRDAVKRQFPVNPFQFEKVVMPWQLDICWAEFCVRGTKAPVMKVVNAMGLAQNSLSPDDYKKLAKPSKEDQRRLLNGLTAMAAHWSMQSLVKKHSLIRFYVEAALRRGEVKNPVAAALSAQAVGIEVLGRHAPEKGN